MISCGGDGDGAPLPVIPTLSNLSGNITIEPSGNVSTGTELTAIYSDGYESVTYQWNKNGSAIPGATGSSYIPSEAGSYTVTVSAASYYPKTSAAVTVTGASLPALTETEGLFYTLMGSYYSVSRGTATAANVVIPALYEGLPVTMIGDFSGYRNMTSIRIPDRVTSIGQNAFSNCTSLTSVALPNSVTRIGSYAFSGCTGLNSVTIPDSVQYILGVTGSDGADAFSECTSLTSITIPNSVKNIGSQAFKDCTGLTNVTFQGTIPSGSFDSLSFGGDLRNKFYATDSSNGTPGTYTRPNTSSTTWTKS